MPKHLITTSANDKQILIDLIRSPAAAQVAAQPHLLIHAQDILRSQKLAGERLTIETDMGRHIGTSEVVQTSEKDTVFYARRTDSDGFARFVKNRSYRPSHYISIVLEQLTGDDYQMVNIHVGRSRPDFPDERYATDESLDFWQNHAVVWEPRLASTKTITRECPWPATIIAT